METSTKQFERYNLENVERWYGKKFYKTLIWSVLQDIRDIKLRLDNIVYNKQITEQEANEAFYQYCHFVHQFFHKSIELAKIDIINFSNDKSRKIEELFIENKEKSIVKTILNYAFITKDDEFHSSLSSSNGPRSFFSNLLLISSFLILLKCCLTCAWV